MPQVLPLAATALAAAAPAAAASAASAAATATLTSTLVSVASQAAVSMAISAAMSLLTPKVGSAGTPVQWTLDPNGPIPFAFGRVGVAGSVIHKRTFGPDKMYYGFVSVLSGAGPIDAYEAFYADDYPVTFGADGIAVSSEWTGEMWRNARLGNQPETFLPSPSALKGSATLPDWYGSHRVSGKALSMLIMGENSKRTAYPNGEVKPIDVLRGIKHWDPRKDSTYPGGLGSHRFDDASTWEWSENPAILALHWILGLWEDPVGKGVPHIGQQVGGLGVKLSGVDVSAYVAAANICDANDWTCAAYPNTDDDKHQVLVSFLQAAGAIYCQRAGKISLIQRAAPRASVVTITANDVIGAIEVDTAASRVDRINTIVPSYWAPEHRWQITALPEVTAQAYRDLDGQKRSRGITYGYVTKARQASQLAALEIAHSREGMAGQVSLKPHLQRIQPGDAFTISEPGFLMDGLKCLCMSTEYDPAEAVVRVTFISETDAKYPFALGLSTVAPTPPTLVAGDNTVSPPLQDDWTVVVRPPNDNGGTLPGFDLTGLVSNATAYRVLVETSTTAVGPWSPAYDGPPTTERVEIIVQPNTQYWIAVSYFNAVGRQSPRMVYGPYTSGDLISGFDQDALDEIRNDFDELIGPVRDDMTAVGDAIVAEAQARILALSQEAQARTQALALETAARAADLLAERTARGEDIAEIRDEVSVVRTDLSAEVEARELQISAVEDSVAGVETRTRTYADDKIAEATLNFTTTAAFQDALSGTLNSAKSYADGIKTYADQTFATTSALNGALAGTLQEAKTYADGVIATASLNFVTTAALNSANSTTLINANTYADGIKTYANQTFVTSSALGGSLAGTLQEAKTYADGVIATASLNFVTTATLNNANANTLQAAKSYADDKVAQSSLTFATKAELNTGNANTLNGAKSYTDALRSDATQIFATQAALGTVSSNATLAMETAVTADDKASALIGLETNVDGLITGLYVANTGRIGNVRVSATHFSVETPGNPADRFEIIGGNGVRIYKDNLMRVRLGFW